MKRWINVCFVEGSVQHADDFYYTSGVLYETREEALKVPMQNRIDCVEIEFEDRKK